MTGMNDEGDNFSFDHKTIGSPGTDQQHQFFLQLYASLRMEITEHSEDRRHIERSAVMGYGIYIAWILSPIANAAIFVPAWFVVTFLLAVCYYRILAIVEVIDRIARYTRDIEAFYADAESNVEPWEDFVRSWRKEGNRRPKSKFRGSVEIKKSRYKIPGMYQVQGITGSSHLLWVLLLCAHSTFGLLWFIWPSFLGLDPSPLSSK